MNNESSDPQRPRSTATLIFLTAAFAFAFGGFLSLGIWQLYRLQWKLDLIKRIDTRIHADPVAAPAPDEWPQVGAARDEYRHVRLEGRFLPGRDTRVQALTALGPGFWVLSPFRQHDGSIVLVNRGYVPPEIKGRPDWKGEVSPSPATEVTGLLRLSETDGGFLRKNDPAGDRWYSRDVAAIAAARGLGGVAPFFVDAAPDVAMETWPRAGLTVTRFSNNHLGYALTWFALALLVAWGGWRLARDERKLRRTHSP